jgi:HTH-type transcriptional regulator/antitoxin HigA
METTVLKYTVIKDKSQYEDYCNQLESLLSGENTNVVQDEIDLLTLLIEKFDEENNTFKESDPIALLRSFMQDHHLKPQHLVEILGISKGYVSDILNYKKGLSKEVIRKLADYFKVRQEAFNRHYKLISADTYSNPSLINTSKQIHTAKH